MTQLVNENGVERPATPEEIAAAQPTFEGQAWLVRERRDYLLQMVVDPLVTNPLRWMDLTEQEKAEVQAYRRALLDISKQEGFPFQVVWPECPECVPEVPF